MSSPNESFLAKFHRHDKIPDGCREFLPSLPVEKYWYSTDLHLYQGFWYRTRPLSSILSTQRHFKALDSDILIATNPKTGTTWLKAIVFALLNRSRYFEPFGKPDHPLLKKNPHDLVPFLEFGLYFDDPNPDLSCFTTPRLFATHISHWSLPESVKDSKCKLVYQCRNPKDTFVSLWNFLSKVGLHETGAFSVEEAFDMFCRGVSESGPYWDHVLQYYQASLEMPHKIIFLRYEEMKEKPDEQLKRLADFLGYPFSHVEEANGGIDEIVRLCSFDNLSSLEANQTGKLQTGLEKKVFFRKGEVGDWVNYLTHEMIERIDRITEEKFRGTGLKL